MKVNFVAGLEGHNRNQQNRLPRVLLIDNTYYGSDMTRPEDDGLGKLLKRARVSAHLSQTEVARRAGVAQSVVSAYESGRREPSISTFERLVHATGHRLVLNLERTYEYPSGIPDTPLGRGFYDLSWFHLGKLVIVITTFADARHCSSCSTITAPSSYVLD